MPVDDDDLSPFKEEEAAELEAIDEDRVDDDNE